MDIEFHYWITAFIANQAGFTQDESRIIACSSQYVDENDRCLEIFDRPTGSKYRNFISQTMNILKPKHQLMRIYPLFHFVPGEPDADTARRRDGKMHILNTTPDNEKANALLDDAFKSSEDTRLYRIGIATHSYADTWAHQNFIGWYDIFNNIGLDLKPDIGHANAEHHPDWISHSWKDSRLVDRDINNTHRFLSASKALFEKYCSYLNHQDRINQWDGLQKTLLNLFGEQFTGNFKDSGYEKQRLAKYKNHLNWLDNFDDKSWFNEAIETDGNLFFKDKYFWRENITKEKTHWYRFQEAVKEHERYGLKIMEKLFKQMDVDIRIT